MNIWLAHHGQALALALRRLFAAPVNTLLSLLAIGVALALPAAGQMLLANLLHITQRAAPALEISVFLGVDAARPAASDIETRLKSHPGVKSFRFLPREDTLTRMKKEAGLADVIDALPKNPFPDAFVLLPKDERPEAMETLAAELRKWPKVEHVQLDAGWARRLDALLRLGRTSVMLLAGLLGVGLVAISFNTIRLQVLTQRPEIELSRLLGASDGFIRRPFYWFGVLQGLLGGLTAWLLAGLTTLVLRGPVEEFAGLYGIALSLRALDGISSLALLALAAGLGWLGTAISLRRHLDD